MSFDTSRARDREPPSPFRYASKSDFKTNPKLPSPQDDGLNSRHAIRSRSLAQAYREVARNTMPVAREEYSPVTTPSPRQKRQSYAFSPYQLSPPPYELQNAYDQIQESEMLSDYVRDEDSDKQRVARRPASRGRQASFQPNPNATNSRSGSANDTHFSDAEFGGDLVEFKNRKSTDYTRDKERLRRATGQPSPVFSKAQAGRDTSRTDNWRRRQQVEAEAENNVSEDDRNLGPSGPSPNLPSGWGYRAGHRQEWERKISPPSIPDQQEQRTRNRSSGSTAENPSPKPAHASRSPARSSLPARSALEERPDTANMNNLGTQQGLGIKETVPRKEAFSVDGEQIPNSPITIYKNSSFTRPSPSKRDSRDLLRSLSRSETHKADEIQTPEPPKLFERKFYDKTPRVTGAWIDTPMTQRVAEKVELPEDLTKDIVLPRQAPEVKDQNHPTKQPQETAPKMEKPSPEQSTEAARIPNTQSSNSSRPPLPRPHLPKSALETVIEDASSGKDVDLGDDTIESLQAIMDVPSDVKIETPEDDEAYEKAVLASLEKANSKEPNDVNIDSLSIKLNSLTRHIHDVQKGLDGLEEQVTRGVSLSSQTGPKAKTKSPRDVHAGEPCKGCGTCSDGRVYAAVRLPRLFERRPRSRRLQPTRLFWLIVIPLCWWIIECLMSDSFSYSEISEPCDGYCLQPDAPVYPWVTVTMLWRWSHLSAICTPILTIIIAFSRLMAQLFGFSDGYVDDLPELTDFIGEIRINGTAVAFPWLSPPTTANVESQTPPSPIIKQPPEIQQPVQRPEYAWPPPDAYTPQWGSDLPPGEEGMDDDEYI
ncbi:unnamed protein product [Penicillium salamii]|uniref:Uncharacterized protein n=1 Tax=Penicillium salamii TaxID=1612424 RepID=A0A9W4NWE7_9EURO|nr:unnamed protein product [Penicillium salamii]CAG8161561.1 unnamed protein product [Penicillium salamii]CAG8162003.1 unnamed protein product [Penicillium salamii]CAG8167048.1 unnamed protein product [Penicillium salamii]CAG8235190.1 unnamed protein product [Penicillium salamii]